MIKIPNNILDSINSVLIEYQMGNEEYIFVAYSGGKDSFLTCLVLRELGFKVIPIILDIGYNASWGEQINLLKQYGIEAYVISLDYIENIVTKSEKKMIIDYFKSIKENVYKGLTACTPCYNGKVLMLEYLTGKLGIHEIAFGHHGTDAVTSLLKSYLMYLDRYKIGHVYFKLESFADIVQEYKKKFIVEINEFTQSEIGLDIKRLLKKGIVGTDEPIRQKYFSFNIIRPLFDVLESEIENILESEDIKFSKAECFRMNIRKCEVLTPREIIQKEIVNSEETNVEIIRYILKLIKNELKTDGTLKYNVRKQRTELLGREYEINLQSCTKI